MREARGGSDARSRRPRAPGTRGKKPLSSLAREIFRESHGKQSRKNLTTVQNLNLEPSRASEVENSWSSLLSHFTLSARRIGRHRLSSRPRPKGCLLYTSPSPRDATLSRMPSSA